MMAAKVAAHVRSIADSHGFEVAELIVYGSVARGDHTADSDVDVIIVSPDFAGTDFYARAAEFRFDWDTEEHPIPDLIRAASESKVLAPGVSASTIGASRDAVVESG